MFEVLLKDCRMPEEEAHQVETLPEEPEEESTNTEMADDEGCGEPEPSDLHEEADTEVAAPPHEVGPYPSGAWWGCCLSQGGCPPHAASIPT